MTTAKKILTLALCLTCLTAGMTGCAKDKSSSDTKIAKSTSSQSESSDSEKIKEMLLMPLSSQNFCIPSAIFTGT